MPSVWQLPGRSQQQDFSNWPTTAICITERPGLGDPGRMGPRAKSRRFFRQV